MTITGTVATTLFSDARAARADGAGTPPTTEIPASLDPRLVNAAHRRKMLFGALPEPARLGLLREAMPPMLWQAPGLEWDQVPAIVAGAVLYTPQWPNRWAVLLAAGVLARNGLSPGSIRTASATFKRLAEHLHRRFGADTWAQLTPMQWREVAEDERLSTATRTTWFEWYQAVSTFHVQEYFESLTPQQQQALAPYAWPRLPARFVDRYVPTRVADDEAHRRRKARTDVLVPITHIIAALVVRRKAAAQRLIEHFRAAVTDVEAGRRQVPVVIEYMDVIADVNRDATLVEEVRWIDRPVRLRFTLWTPRAWTFTRPDVAKSYLRKLARPAASRTDAAYRSGEYFLCFDGDARDLLWFGDVVADGGLWGHPGRHHGRPYVTSTPGVLTPPRDVAVWLRQRAKRGALVLEPESLYRGILFGTALTMLGLTSGARLAELLQVSMDHFLPPRPYRIKRHGQETGELDVIHLQALLPKGRSHERERQPYNVSGAIDLLIEIGELLKRRHGAKIPVVKPRGAKAHELKPERYLFQWGGQVIQPGDVGRLMQFMVHGLEFRDTTGDRFSVSSHIYRHVGVTAARHTYGVPAAVLAALHLHHRASPGEIPEATAYYSEMPAQDQLEVQHRYVVELRERGDAIRHELAIADPAREEAELLARSDDATRSVLEQWHTLHPVLFGHCGRAGLCVRGLNRVLCLGCPYLVPRPEYADRVLGWQKAYEAMAAQCAASGAEGEAREHRRTAQECAKLLHVMQLMATAEREGRWRPVYRALRAPDDKHRACQTGIKEETGV